MELRKNRLDFHRCNVCGCYGTKSLSKILRHVRQHMHRRKLQGHPNVFTCHSNVPDIYKCEDCHFETNLNVSLTHNTNLNHKNLKNQNRFVNILRQCGYCDFQTYSILSLLKHRFKCSKRKKLGTDELDNKVVNWLECGQCSCKTKNKYYLRSHIMRMHATNHSADIVMYQCDNCEYKTKRKDHLKRHRINCHTDSANIVWYHCDNCEFKSKRKDNLKRHKANIHTDSSNIVRYHCGKCEYEAKQKIDLRRHIARIHLYRCNERY